MIILLGEFNGQSRAMPYLSRHGWGRMWASYGPAWDYDGEPWGFDNGAWSAFAKGKEFPTDKFMWRLERARKLAPHKPLVAVIPDVVGDGAATIEFATEWLPKLPQDWPWYLAVQDGINEDIVRWMLPRLAGLFLGGSDRFKRTAGQWCELAHEHGKRFHFGRCNREAWLRNAISIGTDSIDTTRPIRAMTGGDMPWFNRFEQLVTGQCTQGVLPI